jgi:uncharacterized protein YecT (DUF1311 family)
MDGVARQLLSELRQVRPFSMGVAMVMTVTAIAPRYASASDQPNEISHPRQAYEDCVGGSGATTAAMLQCAHAEFVYQDNRLNRIYKALRSSLPVDGQTSLRDEERQWIAQKSVKCALLDDPGTVDQVAAADCEVTETAVRATKLEQRLGK